MKEKILRWYEYCWKKEETILRKGCTHLMTNEKKLLIPRESLGSFTILRNVRFFMLGFHVFLWLLHIPRESLGRFSSFFFFFVGVVFEHAENFLSFAFLAIFICERRQPANRPPSRVRSNFLLCLPAASHFRRMWRLTSFCRSQSASSVSLSHCSQPTSFTDF